MSDAVCIGGFLAISAAVMLLWLIRRGILFRGVIFSAVTGLGSLWVVSLISPALNLGMSLNVLAGAVSVIYGIPGVVGMMVMKLIAV